VEPRLDPHEPADHESDRLARGVRRQLKIGLFTARVLSVGVLVFILFQMSGINSSITASHDQARAAFLLTGTHTSIARFVFETDQGIRAGAPAADTLATLDECREVLIADAEAIDQVIDDPNAEIALQSMVRLNLEVFDLLERATLASIYGESAQARDLSRQALARLDAATAATNELAAVRIDTANDEATEATSAYAQTRTVIIVVGITALLSAMAVHIWMARGVTRRVDAIQKLHQDAARRSSETIAAQDHFLATMSHEVRTPLNGLLGLLESIDTDDLPEETRHALQLAQRSGQDLLVLADDMLDVVSLDTGAVAIVESEARPVDLVDGTLELLRSAATARRTELSSSVHATVPPRIITDQTRLRQILSNLVGNAIKHSEHSSVVVTLAPSTIDGATVEPSAASHLRFSVIDDGPGIITDRQHGIFDRFTTASSFPAATRGTGLGLAISRELVELMGGRIGVRSAAGSGSTFWFTIPLVTADPATQHVAEPPSADRVIRGAEGGTVSDGDGLRVLVAEDDAVNRLVVGTMLERLGHQVTMVEDGVAAVEAVRSEHFDLVLMDIQMPLMDGKDATRAIRSLPGPECEIPIIAVTADVMPHQIAEFVTCGIDLHVGKPYTVAQLDQAIRSAVAGTAVSHARRRETAAAR
jgi:signal transduction histidine kinase/AmiR/NasT family two-component response regulator